MTTLQFEQGVAAERRRIQSIVSAPEALGKEILALGLALETGLPPHAIREMLCATSNGNSEQCGYSARFAHRLAAYSTPGLPVISQREAISSAFSTGAAESASTAVGVEILSGAVDMAPGSLDEASRTIEATFSSGAPVKRNTWRDGEYTEVLSMDPKAIRLDRMNLGAAFLDSHDYYGGTRSMLGAVVPNTVRVEGGKLIGQVKFSKSEEGERAFQDAKDRILRNLSVGYLIHRYEVDDTTTPPTRTATDWEPHEISAVAIPADPNSQFRSLRAPQLSARVDAMSTRLSAYTPPFGSFPAR